MPEKRNPIKKILIKKTPTILSQPNETQTRRGKERLLSIGLPEGLKGSRIAVWRSKMDFELLRSVIINSAIVTALFGIFTMILNSIRNRKGRSNLLKIDFIGLFLFF